MNRLDLTPLQSGYSVEYGDGILTQDLGAGMPRQRADFIGAVHKASATFNLTKEDYNYLMAFYRVYQRNPVPFLVGLILDTPVKQDYTCRFIGPPRFNGKDGKIINVTCQFVAKPLVIDAAYDESIVGLRNGGTNFEAVSNLEKLVNVDLPDALGEVQ